MVIEELIRKAYELIRMSKLGEIDEDEAIDGLWEIIANIEYEVTK